MKCTNLAVILSFIIASTLGTAAASSSSSSSLLRPGSEGQAPSSAASSSSSSSQLIPGLQEQASSSIYQLSGKAQLWAQEGNIIEILREIIIGLNEKEDRPVKALRAYIKNNPDFILRVKKYIQDNPEIINIPITINNTDYFPFSLALDVLRGEEFAPLIVTLIEHSQMLQLINENTLRAFYYACYHPDPQAKLYIKTMIAHGLPINSADENGVTPLMMACQSGNINAVALLLSKKVNVNAHTNSGETALFYAIHPYNPDPNPHASFPAPTIAQQISIIALLLRRGADLEAHTSDQAQHLTPLLYAMQSLNLPVVRFLIQKKANVNAQDVHHFYHLFFVIVLRKNLNQRLITFISKNSSNNEQQEQYILSLKKQLEQSLLILKELLGHPQVNVNSRYTEPGEILEFTPLMFATYFYDYPAVQLLLENGANVNDITEDDRTAYIISQNRLYEAPNIILKEQASLIMDLLDCPGQLEKQKKITDETLIKDKRLLKQSEIPALLSKFLTPTDDPQIILINEMKRMLHRNRIAELITLLVEHPQAFFLTDDYGDTILLQAIKDKNIQAIEAIIKKLTQLHGRSIIQALEHENKQGYNAITLAMLLLKNVDVVSPGGDNIVSAAQKEKLQEFIDQATNIQEQVKQNIASQVADASKNIMPKNFEKNIIVGNPKAIKAVIFALADPDLITSVDLSGNTPLMLAALIGNNAMVEALLPHLIQQANPQAAMEDIRKSFELAKTEYEKNNDRKNDYDQILHTLHTAHTALINKAK